MAVFNSDRNNTKESCKWFKKAIEVAYDTWEEIKHDVIYEDLLKLPCYKEIMAGKGVKP